MSNNKDPMIYVEAIRRKAGILAQDAARQPQRLTMQQRAEEIIALLDLLEGSLKS